MNSNNQEVKKETFIQTSRRGREDMEQGSDWWTRISHMFMGISQEEQLQSETDYTTRGSSVVN